MILERVHPPQYSVCRISTQIGIHGVAANVEVSGKLRFALPGRRTLITLEKIKTGIVRGYRLTATWENRGLARNLARLAGIEPTTLGFGGQYSIH